MLVGERLGYAVPTATDGNCDGGEVGWRVEGFAVGADDDGARLDGSVLGLGVGVREGTTVGEGDGSNVGESVGVCVACKVGVTVGVREGAAVGGKVGRYPMHSSVPPSPTAHMQPAVRSQSSRGRSSSPLLYLQKR
jgi:hypothetical protein